MKSHSFKAAGDSARLTSHGKGAMKAALAKFRGGSGRRGTANAERPSGIEVLEVRQLLSAATDATGFYVAPQLQGSTPVTLAPIESTAAGQPTRVSFGVPFPRGFVTDLSTVRVLDAATGQERPVNVKMLTPWRDLAAARDEASVRSALVQVDVTFADANGDGRADPLALQVEWGRSARTTPTVGATAVRADWVRVADADYPSVHNVWEPKAYAVFTPQWYGQAMLKTRLDPAGVHPETAYYDRAFKGFAGTAGNASRVPYLTDYEPWLYDRATTFFQLAFRTGDAQWLREAHRASQFYANHIDAGGNFDLKGADLKYVTGESVATDYWLTGDERLPAVHQRMMPVFDDFDAQYDVGDFWTERNAAYALLGQVTGFELLGSAAAAQRAKDYFSAYVFRQNNPVAGAPNTGMIMHRSADGAEGGNEWVASPWMSGLLIDAAGRYYAQSGDTRVKNFVTRMADGLGKMGDTLYTGDAYGGTHLLAYYLAGPNLTADQHQKSTESDGEHAINISKAFALAYYFSKQDGAPNATYLARYEGLNDTAEAVFDDWGTGYPLTPSRKFGWWFRTTADNDWLVYGNAVTPPTQPPPTSPGDTTAPTATGSAAGVTTAGGTTHTFTATYSDNVGVRVSSIDGGDVQVVAPNGAVFSATLIGVNNTTDGTPRTATYRVAAPAGTWDSADNGTYTVRLLGNQVTDTSGNYAAAKTLTTFAVSAPAPDTAPPVISGVGTTAVSSASATVGWTTNEASTSQVEYGTTTAYGSLTSLDSSRVTGHGVPLTGLTAGTTYHFRVLSRDAAGNLATSGNYSFTTAPTAAGSVTHTTAAHWNAGGRSQVVVTNTAGGELTLARVFADEFNRTAVGSDWTSKAYAGAAVSVSNGTLNAVAAQIRSAKTYTPATSVEGRVEFTANYQDFGIATDVDAKVGNYWAVFTTGATGDRLYAEVNNSGTRQRVDIGVRPAGMHVYRVVPVTGGYQFLVDGVLKTTINQALATTAKPRLTVSSATTSAIRADWVQVPNYAASGLFTSVVIDAGRTVNWGALRWTADLPAGTRVVVETSTGNTATPDATWSAWSAVGSSGQTTSPDGRYLRYRVTLTSSTGGAATPTLRDVTVDWT